MKRVFCRDTEDRELEMEPWDEETYKEVLVSINDGEDTAVCTINDGQAVNIIRFLDKHFELNLIKEGGNS